MIVALLPILLMIVSMLLFNLGPFHACALGLIAAILLGVGVFGLPVASVVPNLVFGVLSSWDVVILIAGGSLMGALLTVNGTTRALSSVFAEGPEAAGGAESGVLLAGACLGVIPLASAMIGPGAYFVGVPLLISLGIPAGRAIPVFLVSQSWGLAFFTFGLPCVAMSASTGIPAQEILHWSSIPMIPLIIVIACVLRKLLPEIRSVRLSHYSVMTGATIVGALLGSFLGPAFPTLLGGMLGASASVCLQGDRSTVARLRAIPVKGILPVLVVAFHSVLVRVPWVQAVIGSLAPSVHTPAGGVNFNILGSSGVVLLTASLAGCIALPRSQTRKCLETIPRNWVTILVAPLAMSLAKTMTAAGMVTEVVEASASLGSTALIPCLPLVGMLGHYLSGTLVSGSLIVGGYIADLAPSLTMPPALTVATALVGGAPILPLIPQKIAIASSAAQYKGGQRTIIGSGLITVLMAWVVISSVLVAVTLVM